MGQAKALTSFVMADPLETESAEALLSFKNGGFKVKRELDFGDDSDQGNQMTLGPEMFGLKRITDMSAAPNKTNAITSTVALNRRGIPARIRKKNPLFYDDDTIVNQSINKSPRKNSKANMAGSGSNNSGQNPQSTLAKIIKRGQTRSAPVSAANTPERRSGATSVTPVKSASKVKTKMKKMKIKPSFKLPEKQKTDPTTGRRARATAAALASVAALAAEQEAEDLKKLGVRLRNLLKLPKAHKWVCYEWFYSNLDQALFEGENDFMLCLRESFPNLKLRQLTRSQWCTIRRLMGRPRRCSQAFFNEERGELAKKRQKIRLVQQRKVIDMTSLCRDLPDLIPMPLVIGTKVTARLRHPQVSFSIGYPILFGLVMIFLYILP